MYASVCMCMQVYASVCMCMHVYACERVSRAHLIWGENQHGLETFEVNPAVWRGRDGGRREQCKGGRDAGCRRVRVRPREIPEGDCMCSLRLLLLLCSNEIQTREIPEGFMRAQVRE
jgi:hypothetical protein